MILRRACALIGLRVKPPPQTDQRHEATIHALYSVAKGAFKLMGNATWRHTYKKERPNFEMAIAREQHPLKKNTAVITNGRVFQKWRVGVGVGDFSGEY